MTECALTSDNFHPDKQEGRGVSRDDHNRRMNEGLAGAYGIDSPGSLGGALRAPSKQGPDKNEGLAGAYGIDSPGSLGGALRAPSKR